MTFQNNEGSERQRDRLFTILYNQVHTECNCKSQFAPGSWVSPRNA